MIRLRLLGESVIEVDGAPVAPDSQAIFATLLHLGLTRGTRLSRGALHRLLWPAAAEERGRHNLRQTLYKLRQLGVDLDTTPSSILLRPADVEGEVVAIARGEPLPAERVTRGRGLGEFLPGYAPAFSAPFAEWVEEQRAVVHGQLRRALLATMLEQRQRGAWREVELIARQVLQYDALNEEATLALAEAAAMSGGKAQALGILDRYLEEIGGDAGDIRLPATVLRRRIAERLPQHAYASEGDDCFVGREESIALLMEMYRRAKEGRGGAVLIWGEPGIGKTRLLEEFGKMVVLEGGTVHVSNLQPRDHYRPLALFKELVPSLQTLPGSIGISEMSLRALSTLRAFDTGSRITTADGHEAQLQLSHIRKAIVDLIDAVLDENTVVIALDDIHLLDSQSETLLGDVVRLAERRRLLLVATSRSEWPGLLREATLDSVVLRIHALPALSTTHARTVLSACLGSVRQQASAEYLAWCVTAAEGNPFFLRELATHGLSGFDHRELPLSIAAAIEQRLHSLSPEALHVLQLLGILNGEVDFLFAEQALGLEPSELLSAVEQLANSRLIAKNADGLKARHELISDAAIRRLHPVTRKLLHQRAADTLMMRAGDSPQSVTLHECAAHYLHAANYPKAVSLLLRLARHLTQIGFPEEAHGVLRQAAPLCKSESEKQAVLLEHAFTHRTYSQWQDVLESVHDIEQRLPRRPQSPDIALLKAEARWNLTGDVAGTLKALNTIRKSAALSADQLNTALTLGLVVSDNACLSDVCRDYYQAIVEIAAAQRATPNSLCDIIFHSSYGDLDVAVERARALHMERTEHLNIRPRRLLGASVIPLWRAGYLAEAEEIAAIHFYEAERANLGTSAMYAAGFISSIALDQGDLIRGHQWYEKAKAWSRCEGQTYMQEALRLLGIRCLLALGEAAQAASLAKPPSAIDLEDQYLRRRCERLAAWVSVRLSQNQEVDPRIIDALREAFDQSRRFGAADFTASALTRWLRLHDEEGARRMKADYLAERRDRFPAVALQTEL